MLSTLTTAGSGQILKTANTKAMTTPHRKCPAYGKTCYHFFNIRKSSSTSLVRQNPILLRENTRKNASNAARTTATLQTADLYLKWQRMIDRNFLTIIHSYTSNPPATPLFITNIGIMYSQFGVGPLVYLCCPSHAPMLFIFCPPDVPLMCSCSAVLPL